MSVGERIGLMREQAGLTQKALGQKIGVSAVTITRYENGMRNPSINTVFRIAAALDVDPAELFGEAAVNNTGSRIRLARRRAGLTQEHLASRMNIGFQTISQWERGYRNPGIKTLRRIASAIGCDLFDLIGDPLSEEIPETAISIPKAVLQHLLIDGPTGFIRFVVEQYPTCVMDYLASLETNCDQQLNPTKED